MQTSGKSSRRRFLLGSSALLTAGACGLGRAQAAPALIASESKRPKLLQGLQIGDVRRDRALIWARADRAARLCVEWADNPGFQRAQRVIGPAALDDSDFTARMELAGLPPDREIALRVSFQDLEAGASSEPWIGQFRTAPSSLRNVRFVWSGDTAGQGFGINPDVGGMRIYESMRLRKPDFFIHSGDTIYADSPISAQLTVEEGRIWRNIVTPEKSKVAETLAEFRGAYKYNLLDENVRRFNAQVPQIWQWDDHEVINNWSSAKDLKSDDRYTVKSIALLSARAKRAFLEYAPFALRVTTEPERVYRHIPYGPLLDVFVIDMRSYRGPNTENLQPELTPFLGSAQLQWLSEQLSASQARWKVIAADMPLGLVVQDGEVSPGHARFEAVANGHAGKPLGRELELSQLLRTLKQRRVKNVVWLTADVHYTAAHYFDPAHAQFSDFDPFWEFVSGPLNAGSFGPNVADATFGMQVVYQKAPPTMGLSPLAGYQFFGEIEIDAATAALTVTLRDSENHALWTRTLEHDS
jgi:alkaline phosphatase D